MYRQAMALDNMKLVLHQDKHNDGKNAVDYLRMKHAT